MNTDQPTEAKPHNPDALAPEQIGVNDGWRLLDEDEVGASVHPTIDIDFLGYFEQWQGAWYGDDPLNGLCDDITYRTKLTRAELRNARGLEPEAEREPGPFAHETCLCGHSAQSHAVGCAIPNCGCRGFQSRARSIIEQHILRSPEQPKPVTPESLAEAWARNKFGEVNAHDVDCFLAGYRANAERIGSTQILARLETILAENAALKTAAADYAKAAEASAALVEKLTRERDEARAKVDSWLSVDGQRIATERDTLRAELSAAREQVNRLAGVSGMFGIAERNVQSLTAQLSAARGEAKRWNEVAQSIGGERDAANAAREKSEADYRSLASSIQHLSTSPFIEVMNQTSERIEGLKQERDSLKAAMEKERVEAERLKAREAELDAESAEAHAMMERAMPSIEAGIKERDDLRRQIAEWQAVAAKKDAALESIIEYWNGAPEAAQDAIQEAINIADAALESNPPTALLDELERAFRSGVTAWRERADDSETASSLWLASATRKRHSGAPEAGA